MSVDIESLKEKLVADLREDVLVDNFFVDTPFQKKMRAMGALEGGMKARKRGYCWHPCLMRLHPGPGKWPKGWKCTNCQRVYLLRRKHKQWRKEALRPARPRRGK